MVDVGYLGGFLKKLYSRVGVCQNTGQILVVANFIGSQFY